MKLPLILRRSASPRRRDVDFLPAVLEIVETAPSPAGRSVLWAIILLVVCAAAWAWFGNVDIIASAEGVVVPSERVKAVQPSEPGVVKAIRVVDGAHVKQGDVLVELDSTSVEADVVSQARSLMLDRTEEARLRAALEATRAGVVPGAEAAFVPPPGTEAAVAQDARARLRFQLGGLRAKLADFAEQIQKLRSNLVEIAADISRFELTLPLAKVIVDIREELASRGLGSRLEALTERQHYIGQEQDLIAAQARLAQTTSQIASLEQQGQEAIQAFNSDTAAQLATVTSKISTTVDEYAKAAQRLRETRLLAPIDGSVQDLAIHTVGGVVTAAQRLMTVVPDDGGLEIEAKLPDKDAGFVYVGQPAVVKLAAYPFTRYGRVKGRVVGFARDAERDERRGLLYSVRVVFDEVPEGITPRSGMAGEVEIWTGRRRVADYLLSPLEKRRDAAFRER